MNDTLTANNASASVAPDDAVGHLIAQGVALRQQGQTEQAAKFYRQATELPNAPAEAFFNLGNALRDLGELEEAEQAFAECLLRNPQMHRAHLQLARVAVARGNSASAREHFAQVLRAEPDNFSAWLEAGHVCRSQSLPEQMLQCYRRAAEVAPDRWEGHIALAIGLEEVQAPDAAAAAYHHAVTAAGAAEARARQEAAAQAQTSDAPEGNPPATPPRRARGLLRKVHWRMAKSRLERGQAGPALEAMRQALMAARVEDMAGTPLEADERAEMQIDLGEILMRLGLQDAAHRAFERASGATSEATLVRLAELSFRFNMWQEAQEVLKRNVELHPDSALAHWNLAHSYAESWQMEDALAELARAEAIAPQPGARSMRASVAGRLGDADEALRLYKALAIEEGPQSKMRSSAAMSALYSDKLSAREVADLHRELFALLGEGARPVDSFSNERNPERRIRLGLVTADFHHQHPVNIFMQPVLARLDASQFEVTVYFTGVSFDEETSKARSRAHRWVECRHWSDEQLARRIAADGIDLLLDLAGHTSMHRMAMFARRAAPVQATFLGYPGSTGVPNIDWILTDPVVAPEGSEGLFSEQVMRLPQTVFCYSPEADYPSPVWPDEAAARPLTFGSFNNVPKLTPRTLALWARVLQAVPGSRLLLKAPSFKDEGAIRVFRERFEKLGIAADRLEFRGPVGLNDMMAEYADVDVALDPVPYNGGTTTLQALWMGAPVLALEGHNFVSRMGASFMRAAGLPEWVAGSDDDYVAKAVQISADRAALLALKRGLRERLLASPAWDIDAYARDFQAALRRMWQAHCGAPAQAGAARTARRKGNR